MKRRNVFQHSYLNSLEHEDKGLKIKQNSATMHKVTSIIGLHINVSQWRHMHSIITTHIRLSYITVPQWRHTHSTITTHITRATYNCTTVTSHAQYNEHSYNTWLHNCITVTTHAEYSNNSHNTGLHVNCITVTTHAEYINHSHNTGLHITVSQWRHMHSIITTHITLGYM
jgi:hypothetical protein